MKKSIIDYIKSLPKHSKEDPVPGTYLNILDDACPMCGRKLVLMKPCCTNPDSHLECYCGYKANV